MPTYSASWSSAPSFDELVSRQAGVVSRAQLFASGVHRTATAARLASGRWQRAGPRAVLLQPTPPTAEQALWAALVNAGPVAALCGLSAAILDGLTGFATRLIHVVVPRGTHLAHLPGVRVHVSTSFDRERDVHPVRLPPRTRLPRSLVDAAMWSPTPATACSVLAASVQQRLVTAPRLRDEITARPRARWRSLLVGVLDDVEGGSHSSLEVRAARLRAQAGLPPPHRQAVRTDSQGRRRYVDLLWPQFRLCVEVDGAFHRDVLEWRRDLDRQNDLVLDGLRVLRFPGVTLWVDPGRFVDQVQQAMRRAPPT